MRPAGDFAQVPLALGLNDVDQVLVGQHGRGAQDRAGHLKLVPGQTPDQAAWGLRRLRKPLRQFGAHGGLHLGGEVGQNRVIKSGFRRRMVGRAKEVVGQLAQQQPALVAGRFAGQGDQVGQARAVHDRRGLDRGRRGQGVAHDGSPLTRGAAGCSLPEASRRRAGAAGGAARSVVEAAGAMAS